MKRAFARGIRHRRRAGSGYNDQTSYALAFLWDLIPDEHVEAAKRYFRRSVELTDGKIGTGFIGTPAILPALVKIGAADLAEKVFLQLDVPGWLYQVERGATTIWERWDAIRADGTIYDPDMNSYNHYAYGAVCQWLFEGVAGFRPDPEHAGLPAHRLRADDPARGSASCGRATTRRPGGSRPPGRSRTARSTTRSRVPEGAEGLLVLGRQPSRRRRRRARPRRRQGPRASRRASTASASGWRAASQRISLCRLSTSYT